MKIYPQPLTTMDKDNHQNLKVSNYDTILEVFLKNIGQYELLTRGEEVELATKVMTARNSTDKDVLKVGIEARDKLILSNLRLVVSIAKKYTYTGISFMDLIQDGVLGLMKAVDRYQIDKDLKLSTYATWRIKQSIKRSIANTSRTIRLPEYIYDLISQIRKTRRDYFNQHSILPDAEMVSQITGIDKELLRLIDIYDDDTISLDTMIGDTESTIMDMTKDIDNRNPDEHNQIETLEEYVLDCLELLTERERNVLKMRFGIQCDEKTLEETGEIMQITRERVR